MQYDTIVIGLGSAGVTAASTLAKAGRKVLALEAQNRIGGRVNTVPFGDGVVELGAEWIHGQYPSRVYDTAIQNNITVRSQNLTIDVYRSDGSRADSRLVNELIDYCMSVIELVTDEREPLASYITRKLMDHIKETKPELLNDKEFLDEFLDLMDLVIDNYEGSDNWNDVSTVSSYKELEGDQHLSWHRYGYKTFFELLLNTYQGGPGLANLDIKLNKEVTKIAWPQTPATQVVVTCKDGTVYEASNVIITVSVGVLKDRYKTLFDPPLPQEKALAIERLSMGIVNKVVLAFPSRWWPEWDSYWLKQTKQEREKILKDNGWLTYGVTGPMGSRNTISLWYTGATARLVSIYRYKTLFDPPLPQEKALAIERLSMGIVNKVVLAFPSRWWPECDSYWLKQTKQERENVLKDNGWVTYFASGPMGSRNTISLWYTGASARLVSIYRHSSLFSPPLPQEKVVAIEGLTMGVMDKIVFSFNERWWPTYCTFFGFLWRAEDKKSVAKEDHWTTKIFGASSPMGSSNTLTLWTSGESGKLVETLPEEVVKRKSVELLQKFLGANVTVSEPSGMHRTTWYSNPFTRGSYTFDSVASMKYPNSRSDLGKPLLDSAGTPKVLFAGEATDLTHFSTVHGASDSGHREAMRLLPSSKI